jgi:phosphoribosylanthranilate isomerase
MTASSLRALGFCGADDSVHPNLLVILSHTYPLVEFGVLFRQDKEGEPRYASAEWVQQLVSIKPSTMKLAAHLCSSRVNQVLEGNDEFVSQLSQWEFQRVQINATAVNGVDITNLAGSVCKVMKVIQDHPELEFIIQRNDETKALWEGLLDAGLPPNVSMLLDESKGTGKTASSWPSPPSDYLIGYAGGIGPHNIDQVITDVLRAAQDRQIWIDMESSLRSIKNDRDVFDLDKCYSVIDAVCSAGLMSHPEYLRK